MPVRLNGSTSGYVELAAPAVAGTTSLELPTDSIKPGLVLVAAQSFSAVSSVSVNNCFTATYDNYRVLVRITAAGSDGFTMLRFRVSGTDSTAGYFSSGPYATVGGVTGYFADNNAGAMAITALDSAVADGSASLDIYRPALAQNTTGINNFGSNLGSGVWAGGATGFAHAIATSYDGFTLYPSGGSTITGSLQVFGYRKTV